MLLHSVFPLKCPLSPSPPLSVASSLRRLLSPSPPLSVAPSLLLCLCPPPTPLLCDQRASKVVARKASPMDGQLFLIKHLLILREQIAPFDVEFAVTIKELDFAHTLDHLRRVLRGQASFLSLTSGESFLRFSPRVTESHIDAKKELEKLLKSTCEQLIMSVTKLTVEPILSFITKVTAVRVAGSALALKARGGDAAAAGGEGHAGQRLLREQAFASPEKLAQVVKQDSFYLLPRTCVLQHVREGVSELVSEGVSLRGGDQHGSLPATRRCCSLLTTVSLPSPTQVDEALKVSLPGVVANMALSLPVPHTALLTLLLILPPLPLSPIFFTTPSSPQVDEALKVSLPDVVANMALSLPLPHTAAVHPSQLSPFHKPPPLPTPALQVDEALKVSLPDVVANMALYLPHAATRAILFRPIKSNILEAHAQLQSLVDSEYTEEDRAVVGLISSADLVTFLDGLT
ncbi:unnamed protein product [Closterium sp. NIES-53]